MIFCLVVIFVVRIIVLPCSSMSIVVPAAVGTLVRINASLVDAFRGSNHLPDWVCNVSEPYSGIPTMRSKGPLMINANLTVDVNEEPVVYRCVHRWPTLMVLVSDLDIAALSGCERLRLWRLLQRYLPRPVHNLRLVEDVSHLMRWLSILSKWDSPTKRPHQPIKSAVVSHIGCGLIPQSILESLRYFEKPDKVNNISKMLSLPIHGWLVADHIDPLIVRRQRHSRNVYQRYSEFSSVFYQHERQQKQDWNEARIIIEGSGLFDENWTQAIVEHRPVSSENKTFRQFTRSSTSPPKIKVQKKNSMPIVKRSLKNVTVFVGTKRFYEIPSQTFFDEEDGDSRQLTMKLFLSSPLTGRDEPITFNTSHWIHFLRNKQFACLQPRRINIGYHDMTVCAFDSDGNRICDGMRIIVKNQKPIDKKSEITSPSGVVWKYTLGYNWTNEVKHSDNDTVTIRVKSSSLTEWNSSSSFLSLVTEAHVSRIHKILMIAESETTGKTLSWTITVTTHALNSYIDETSPEILLKFSFANKDQISFEFINTIKERLIAAIRANRQATFSTIRNIFLFRIISGKEIFLQNSTTNILVISFVYSLKKRQYRSSNEPSCSMVHISKPLLNDMKSRLASKSQKWTLVSISLINIRGKCVFEDTNQRVSTTFQPNPADPNDSNLAQLLNKTIELEVKNGFTFKKMIVFPFEPIFKQIRSMQLYDSNDLIIDESSWVLLSQTQFAIYGIPMVENVRPQSYKFKLKVAFQSGREHWIVVNIFVVRFVPKFSHKFAIVISISERDTLELSQQVARPISNGNSFRTMGQLLVSQNLSYRWQLVQTLARYLNGDQCVGDCGTNIFVYSFSESKTWQINISWSMVFDSPNSPDYPTIYSVASCSDTKLNTYIRSLMVSDQVTESIISAFPMSVSKLQANPHQKLVKSFQTKHIGTPSWVTVESSGACSDSSQIDSSRVIVSSNISVTQGSIFQLPLQKKKNVMDASIGTRPKIYFLNGTICDLAWFQLSADGQTIYGLPLPPDVVIQTYFSLRILHETAQNKSNLNYYISMSINPVPQMVQYNHIVNTTISMKKSKLRFIPELDFRIRLARALNGYFHPTCTLGHVASLETGYVSSDSRKFLRFCQVAEDIVLHSIDRRVSNDNLIVDVLWSQSSVLSIDGGAAFSCDLNSLQYLSLALFQNDSSQKISQELISFFDNYNIGRVIGVQLHLSRQCLKAAKTGKIDIPHAQTPTDIASRQSRVSSSESTKIILGIFFFLLILAICICIAIYVYKRGLPFSFSRLTENKNGKPVALEDFNSAPPSKLKNPLSNFTKKPKLLSTTESIGPSFSSNSPKTPLLSQFSKDDTKSDKPSESVFANENATGSFSYALCHPQSPEPAATVGDNSPVNNAGAISKQPATSNVIRNPAMMMGSRLNPYRNIPPPII